MNRLFVVTFVFVILVPLWIEPVKRLQDKQLDGTPLLLGEALYFVMLFFRHGKADFFFWQPYLLLLKRI